jgi:PAS domain S-box-containing protein
VQPTPTRVLLVDDDQGDFEMIRVMLSQAEHGQFKVDWVATYEEALDAFEREAHDVYFVDYFLEDRTGLDLLREAQRRGIAAPVIMLTGRGSRAVDQEALEAGAADYLVKGLIDPPALERSIRHATERTKAARALQESEERHRSLFEHLPVGLYRTAPDGTLMDVNPALVRILRYSDRNSLERNYSNSFFVHPDERDRFWSVLEQHGVIRGFESSLPRADGTSVPVRITARLHRGATGEILYLEGLLEDTTEERAAAEDRIRKEPGFRATIEDSRSAIAMLDLHGRIIEVNPAFVELFSIGNTKPEGMSFVELLEPGHRESFLRELQHLSRGDRIPPEGERRFEAGDGSLFWAQTSAVAVRDAEGRPGWLLLALQLEE